ncbi:MAG: hypothetical protein FJ096_16190 [Deltaproteobacteria bacterium]|nr:hypothetical protein [Deltaproteobacteria bacterium]
MAIELAPGDIELRLRHAVLLAEAGRPLEAQDAFTAVLDRDPSNLDALVSLAHLCRRARHLVGAVDLLEHARSFHGDHPEILAALTHLAVDLEDRDGAIRLLVHLQRRAPAHPEAEELVRRLADLRSRDRLASLGL